ncbi:HNH endonuclease [Pseudomonas moorei]|uniref:HNH endonuclease n=1 Tax=Pseudomonas moorei TaxID=395599 RepID=UPI001FF6B67B|nr:HNH endonuclease [Pseudomonas moorei]
MNMTIDIIRDTPNLALQERFEIDPTSPSGLRWRTKGNGYMPGDVAGSRNPKGYWKIGKEPNKLLAHRAVYEMTYGPIPASTEIDHKDGDPSNNRVENLRIATHSQNGMNKLGSASADWFPKCININRNTGLVQGIVSKDGSQYRPGKGFFEQHDTSSQALNDLAELMRKAIEALHGPYANAKSYYCQLPVDAVLGPLEGFPEFH